MKFPWYKYEELPTERRNTLQVFICNVCNRVCSGCFARNVMDQSQPFMEVGEYTGYVKEFLEKGGVQVNLLGGEPLIHPQLGGMLDFNRSMGIKTTIYTNGDLLHQFNKGFFSGVKIRVSLYSLQGVKSVHRMALECGIPFDANFMISANTTVQELLDSAAMCEKEYNCKTFFLFSMRELDNPDQDFFTDTPETGSIFHYKKLVHEFMELYDGSMDIHVSKRGVFESTVTPPDNRCRFANCFTGGRIIQCPYDVVNCVYQDDYSFGTRNCQHNSTCLMSKVIYRRKVNA